MKTKRRVLKKIGRLVCIALLAVGTQSCDTEIPIEDNTPPEFRFQITGSGVNYTFDQDFDFENHHLRLKPGEIYDFTFTGSDQGGVRKIKFSITNNELIGLQSEISSPWNLIENNRESNIIWYGDRNNPTTGNIVNGKLKIHTNRAYTSLDFEVIDYGGDHGGANITSERLSVYLTHHHLGVRRNFGS